MDGSTDFHRRKLLFILAAAGVAAITGCGPKGAGSGEPATSPERDETYPDIPVEAAAMTIYRDPNCGCCGSWADLARRAGYTVSLIDSLEMSSVKKRHGVPEELASCHTTLAGNYVIEGHVPFAAIRRLLKERPGGIRGIAVPGMPRGSPGMALPDGSSDAFEVLAFDARGKAIPYRAT